MLDQALSIVGLAGLVFLLYLWVGDLRLERRLHPTDSGRSRSRLWMLTAFILAVMFAGLVFVRRPALAGLLAESDTALLLFCIGVSALISVSWYLYLRRLDHFEPEPFWPQLLAFILACLSVALVGPLTQLVYNLGLDMSGNVFEDFLYCVFGIGLVEEVVKIIPFLIILRFTRHVNEPFDYILYGSICALGFAFVENILYLYNYELSVVGGRALYASVAHMFDTSVICYSMAIARYYRPSWRPWAFVVGLGLASLAHGFYDFWLLSPAVSFLSDLTLLFYLVTLYLWTVMKNNLMNLSNFFSVQRRIRPSDYKYITIAGLVASFMLAAVGVHLFNEHGRAIQFLWNSLTAGVFVRVFITVTLSRIRLVSGYVAPFRPDGSLVLTLRRTVAMARGDELGDRLELTHLNRISFPPNKQQVADLFPLHGELVRNMVVNRQHYWYLVKLDEALPMSGYLPTHVLVRAIKPRQYLAGERPVKVEVRVVKQMPPVKMSVLLLEETALLAEVYSQGSGVQ